MIMFADGWGGSSAESTPGPKSGGGLSPELIDSCRESTRRAERLVERLSPSRHEVDPAERFEELGWAIRAIEEAQGPEADN